MKTNRRWQFHTPSRRVQLIALGIAVVLGLIMSGLYASYRLGLRPVSTASSSVSFKVSTGQNAQIIADALVEARLIRDRNAFITYVNFHNLRAKLKAGTYKLSPAWSADRIARVISGGYTASQRLVVPEGHTLVQIRAAALSAGLPTATFDAALAEARALPAVQGIPAGVSLEGYLFPDSYAVDSNTSASQLVKAMIDNFAAKVGPEYVQAFAKQGLTVHQAVTIASMVEREVNISADRPVVAQIFLKRWRSGQSLGSDVTTQYAADLLGLPFSVDINSPYNTRRFTGLPPGPICSPGISALDAVARPAATDYLYFLSGNDGKTYYANTYAEHQQNIVKHLQ